MPQRRSSGSCCNWMTLPFSDSFEFDCRSWTGIRTVTSSAYPSNRLVHPVDGAPTRGASVSFSNLPTIPNTPCSYYNGLLCHMRALARILPNPQFNRRPHSPVPAPAVPAPPRPT